MHPTTLQIQKFSRFILSNHTAPSSGSTPVVRHSAMRVICFTLSVRSPVFTLFLLYEMIAALKGKIVGTATVQFLQARCLSCCLTRYINSHNYILQKLFTINELIMTKAYNITESKLMSGKIRHVTQRRHSAATVNT